jgi:hypothetical protein
MAPISDDCILGMRFLLQHKSVLDLAGRSLLVNGVPLRLFALDEHAGDDNPLNDQSRNGPSESQ